MKTFTRGRLADQAGVHAETLRYYERRGLLPKPMRSESGYRIYGEESLDRVRFIKHAQELGFSLKEISSLLNLRVDKKRTCREVKRIAEAKIADLNEKLRVLRRMKMTRRFIFVSLLTVASYSTAMAHEPVFSLGPETIYQGGLGIETGFEFDKREEGRSFELDYEILYGLTKDLSLTLAIPQILDVERDGASRSGLGDILFRGKYQLYRRDTLHAQDKLAAILGVKFPSGEDEEPRLGTGTTDYLFGLSAAHESRTWYAFATLRYLLRGEDGPFEPGDRFFYDASTGYRPWRREYLEWDLVFLLEMSGQYDAPDESGGRGLADSGGNTIWLGPSALLSYRNIMFKAGVQFPVYQDLRGSQDEDEFRSVLAVEYHF